MPTLGGDEKTRPPQAEDTPDRGQIWGCLGSGQSTLRQLNVSGNGRNEVRHEINK